MYHEASHIVYFQTFSVKCKENNLHRKYMFLGTLWKIALVLQFHRYKSYDFISFTKTTSREPQYQFFKLLKNKILKIIILFFQIF